MNGTERLMPKKTLEMIKSDICASFGVSEDDLIGRSRKKTVVMARKMFAALGYTEAKASLHEIGAALGGRDHTTVLYYIESVKRLTLTSNL